MQHDEGDLHTHSSYSDGLDPPEILVTHARRAGLRVLAITDHDTVRGGVEGAKHGGDNLIVVPGIEISTRDGHLLCLGVYEEPRLRKCGAEEAIEWCHQLGGVSIYAHPFGYLLRPSLCSTRRIREVAKLVDAIEVINGRTLARYNAKALELANELSKPVTAGSDAHLAKLVGSVRCRFLRSVDSVDDVLRCVKNGLVEPLGPFPSLGSVLRAFVSKHVERVKRFVERRSTG